MHTSFHVLTLVTLVCILPTPTHQNPYGYYSQYSRSRRDPAASWQPNYAGVQGVNPVMQDGGYRGGADSRLMNPYGVGSYASMGADNPQNPLMTGMETQQQMQRSSSPLNQPGIGIQDFNGQPNSQRVDTPPLAPIPSEGSNAPTGCAGVTCDDLTNCINVAMNDSECCPKCVQYGCECQGYQVYDCRINGFSDGMLPGGKSYKVASGTTVCSCPPGGGSIMCSFHDPTAAKCPELPPNCIEPYVRDIDGCKECAMVGCLTDDGAKVAEGTTMNKPPCTTCYCPPSGGKMFCGVDTTCDAKQRGNGNLAMQSSMRVIDSFRGGYPAYGGYPDYGNPSIPLGSMGSVSNQRSSDKASEETTSNLQGKSNGGYGGYYSQSQYSMQYPYQFPDYGGDYSNIQGGYGSQGYNKLPYGGFGGSQLSGGADQGTDSSQDSEGKDSSDGTVQKPDLSYTGSQSSAQHGGEFGAYGEGYNQNPYRSNSYLRYNPEGVAKESSDSSFQSAGNIEQPGDSRSSGNYRRIQNAYGVPFDGYRAGYGNNVYPSGANGDSAISNPMTSQQTSGGSSSGPSYGSNSYAMPSLMNPYGQFPSQDDRSVAGDDGVSNPRIPEGASQGMGYQLNSLNRGYYPQEGTARYNPSYQFERPAKDATVGKPEVPDNIPETGASSSGNSQSALGNPTQAHDSQIDEYQPFAGQGGYLFNQGYQQQGQNLRSFQQSSALGSEQYGQYQPVHNKFQSSFLPESGNENTDTEPTLSVADQPRTSTNAPEINTQDNGNSDQFSPLKNAVDIQYREKLKFVPDGPRSSYERQSRRIRDYLTINKGRLSHEPRVRPQDRTVTVSPPTTTTITTSMKPTTTSTTTTKSTTTTTPKPITTTVPTTATTTTTKPTTTTTTTTKPTTTTTTTPIPTTTTTTSTKPTTAITTTTEKTTTSTTTMSTAIKKRINQPVVDPEVGGMETLLMDCCTEGKSWAATHYSCDAIALPTGENAEICRSAQKQCCMEVKDHGFCQVGIITAQNTGSCSPPVNLQDTCGVDKFMSCCDCCRMGLKAREIGMSCTTNVFDRACGSAYSSCCEQGPAVPLEKEPTSTERTTTTTETTTTTTQNVPRCATDSTCQHLCGDTEDGMICSCYRGFRLQEDGKSCVDINECVIETHTCTANQLCLNRQGSFFCQRRLSCGTGYELTERNTCEDIDECSLDIHDCLPNTNCENIRGSYRCIPKSCDAGYITDATGKCIDINECRTGDFTCPIGARCINTEGSYKCACSVGLAPDAENERCEDIDECQMSLADCSERATCVNTIGSYICREPPQLRCSPGYEPNDEMTVCVDVDECTAGTHSCESGSTCINEEGSFRCQDPLVCPNGMRPDEEERVCEDINECLDPSLHRCDQGGRCLNLRGSFTCVCDEGYESHTSSDGIPSCLDINECEDTIENKCAYKCKNLPGSFECFCPTGYRVGEDPNTCEDIDECAAPISPCSATDTCFNTQGSKKCVDLSCPKGYKKYSNTRCSRLPCRGKPRSCLKLPKQISYHNISVKNGTIEDKPLFRMSVARTTSNSRYKFSLTSGNEDGLFKVRTSNSFRRPSGVVYTAEKLVGPGEYVVDLTLNLIRSRRQTSYISKLYIYVGEYGL